MKTIKLFHWFADTLLGKDSPPEITPVEVLERLGISAKPYQWLSSVKNGEYPLLTVEGEQIPDLEARHNSHKRTTGQYYTPEEFVKYFYDEKAVSKNLKVIDPACGTGAFLVPYIKRCNDNNECSLDKVWGVDIDAQALLITLARLLKACNFKGIPKLILADFLFITTHEKFDLVIGNPPYKVNLDEDYKKRLKKRFKTFEGEKDLYTFFIEAGIERLSKNGRMIFLTSHTYMVNKQCAKIRELVFSQNHAENLYLLPERFFPKAPGVLPVILDLRLGGEAATNETTIHTNFDKENGWKNVFKTLSQSLSCQKGFRRALIPESLKSLFDCMESNNLQLGDICRIGVGIQESSNRGDVISRFVSDAPIGNNSKKVLKGREIGPFYTNWEGKYLDYGKHLTYAGKPEVFDNPKVLYQNIRNEKLSTRLVATLDRHGFYPKNSISTISGVREPFSLEFIVGLLNSSIVNAWFSGHYFSFHITVTNVRSIPLPEPKTRCINAVEKIVKKMEKDPKCFETLQNDLDVAVLDSFGVSENHSWLIEQCHNFLEQVAKV